MCKFDNLHCTPGMNTYSKDAQQSDDLNLGYKRKEKRDKLADYRLWLQWSSSLVGTFSALLPSFHIIEVMGPVSQSLKSITSICWPLLPCWHFEAFRARIGGEGLSRSMTVSVPLRPF